MINKLTFLLVISAGLYACGNQAAKHTDTSTSGTITIAVDESLKPLIEAEKDVFTALYPDAHLNMVYTNESEAVNLLTNDSARIAIVTRELNTGEKSSFEQKKIYPKSIVIGYDAIALILNPARKDTILTLSQVADVLSGKITNWNQLDPASKAGAIKVVFDHGRSGAVRYLRDSLLKGAELSSQCYAVNSNPEVIGQVEKDANTIGIIGAAWISDEDDSTANQFLGRIKVAGIVPRDPQTAKAPVMRPYQAYIALKQYPLYRNVYIINPEGRYGLGTGFASFINSDRGQRIILKSDLVPGNAPVRIIELNND